MFELDSKSPRRPGRPGSWEPDDVGPVWIDRTEWRDAPASADSPKAVVAEAFGSFDEWA